MLDREMKAATAEQRRIWGKLAAVGCIACWKDGNEGTPGEVHHIKGYGNRDHSRTIILCPPHHRPTAMVKGVPSIHYNRLEFIEEYGPEEDLLDLSFKLIVVVK